MTATGQSRAGELALFLLGLVVFGLVVAFVGPAEVLARLARFSLPAFLVYAGFAVVIFALHAFRWRRAAASFGPVAPYRSFLGARIAGDAVGSLVPGVRVAGDPVRAMLVHDPRSDAGRTTAGVALDRIVESLAGALAASIYVGVFVVSRAADGDGWGLLVLPLVLLGALVVPLVVLRSGRSLLGPFSRFRPSSTRLRAALDAVVGLEERLAHVLRERPGTFFEALALMLVTEGLVILQYFWLLAAFDVSLDLPTLLMVLVTTGFALAAPTPGGLGALEAGQVALLTLSGRTPEVGLAVGVVIRLHEVLASAAGLAVLFATGASLARVRLLAERARS